ncbi:MAG: hypothetical protein Q7R84_00940 [bacterium]|nr:hypothetical protein [bacterium]
MIDEITSRAWNIEIESGDGPQAIETKKKIRRVLEMAYKEKKSAVEIVAEVGFSHEEVNRIITKEITFVLGPGRK